MKTFNKIFIINLHGNYRIKEKTPDGKIDENVFDIMQGVSISIFIKSEENSQNNAVKYYDLWGTRKHKENFCWNENLYQSDLIKY